MAVLDKRPLAGLTVIELTVNVPGPFCAMILGDLGARVIKVEPPGGDPLRHSEKMWPSLNRGKDSVVLNLKTDHGQEVLSRLVENSDVVLEGFRPGVAGRLGADYDTLLKSNSRLVYCSISGFGQEGPWKDRPAHDINYLSLSGYLGVEMAATGTPVLPPILISDLASGLYSSISVLASVYRCQKTGQGMYVDLSMTESALSLMGIEIESESSRCSDLAKPNVTYIPHYGVFPCADGKWISLGIVHEDHFWDRFCKVAGLNDMIGLEYEKRLVRSSEIQKALHLKFASREAFEWERILQEVDVPAAVVIELKDVFDSPQFKARGTFADVGIHRFVSQPMQFSSGSVSPTSGPPDLGQHCDLVLTELGYTLEEQSHLEKCNVVQKSVSGTV